MTLTDNLISYWKFDESSGNAADSVGSNPLTNNNTATFVPGKIYNAADLEKDTIQYFSILDADQTGLDFSDAVSFSMWIKPESLVIFANHLVTKSSDTGPSYLYRFLIEYDTAYGLAWYSYSNPNGSVGGRTGAQYPFIPGNWYHIVVTKTGTTIVFYVNGNALTNFEDLAPAVIADGTAPFCVGVRFQSGSYLPFDGLIDELGAWNRALTSDEVTTLYNGGRGLSYPFILFSPFPSHYNT